MILRIRFTKRGKVRFVGHRDLARVWERALRRTGLPVAYTEGFSPRPRVSFGLALPLGDESDGEYLDVRLVDAPGGSTDVVERVGAHTGSSIPVTDLPLVLSAALPAGIDVVGVGVEDRSVTSLQEAVVACSWVTELPDLTVEQATTLAERIDSAATLPFTRTRKGREVDVDLAPMVERVGVDVGPDASFTLRTTLAASPFVVRPYDVIAAAAPGTPVGLTRRTHQWIEGDDDTRREPLPPAPSAAATRIVAS